MEKSKYSVLFKTNNNMAQEEKGGIWPLESRSLSSQIVAVESILVTEHLKVNANDKVKCLEAYMRSTPC